MKRNRSLNGARGLAAMEKATFIYRLESMRGVAALFVAICHSFIWCTVFGQPVSVMPVWQVHDLQPLIARFVISITNGGAWVDFFFVLSGFVLAKSLAKNSDAWWRFIVRRAFRIVPAMLASLALISALLAIRNAFDLFPTAKSWHESWYFTPVGPQRFLENALMLTNELNPPSWTLRIEMLAAVGLPAAYALLRSIPATASGAFVCAACVVTVAIGGVTGTLAINFLPFLIGIFCALHGTKVTDAIGPTGSSIVAAAAIIVICLIQLPFAVYPPGAHVVIGMASGSLVMALGSGHNLTGFGWLNTAPLRFLGRISFSFYLLHFAILYAVTLPISAYNPGGPFKPYEMYPLAAMALSSVVSIGLCIPIASIMYRFVELPSVAFGKRLAYAALPASNRQRSI